MKYFLAAAVSIALLASCQSPVKNEESNAASNEEIVTQMFAHFNKHEWEEMGKLYADSFEVRDPALGTKTLVQTREEMVGKYRELNGFLPDISDSVTHIYPSGEKSIIVEFVSFGTMPDGVKMELPICTVFRIENGKITGDYTYYDNAGM